MRYPRRGPGPAGSRGTDPPQFLRPAQAAVKVAFQLRFQACVGQRSQVQDREWQRMTSTLSAACTGADAFTALAVISLAINSAALLLTGASAKLGHACTVAAELEGCVP
jgi:hypothetical protein